MRTALHPGRVPEARTTSQARFRGGVHFFLFVCLPARALASWCLLVMKTARGSGLYSLMDGRDGQASAGIARLTAKSSRGFRRRPRHSVEHRRRWEKTRGAGLTSQRRGAGMGCSGSIGRDGPREGEKSAQEQRTFFFFLFSFVHSYFLFFKFAISNSNLSCGFQSSMHNPNSIMVA
jgi:hypothetical protein